MMRRVTILMTIPLLALLSTLAHSASQADNDSGPLSAWLEKLKSTDGEERLQAARELQKLTVPEAIVRRDPLRPGVHSPSPQEIAVLVPALAGTLRDADPEVRWNIVSHSRISDRSPRTRCRPFADCLRTRNPTFARIPPGHWGRSESTRGLCSRD